MRKGIALLIALAVGMLAGCTTDRERVGTTGVLGCAPEPLTDAQVGLIRTIQTRGQSGLAPISPQDRAQVNQYLGRCGQLDPVTGERVRPQP